MDQAQKRQGDLLFIIRKDLPEGKKLKKREGLVLAYGEVTGHMHKVVEVDAGDCTLLEDEEGNIFVKAKKPFTVGHDEHGKVDLPAGIVEVRYQREDSLEGPQRVRD